MVKTKGFYSHDLDSIPGQGTKIPIKKSKLRKVTSLLKSPTLTSKRIGLGVRWDLSSNASFSIYWEDTWVLTEREEEKGQMETEEGWREREWWGEKDRERRTWPCLLTIRDSMPLFTKEDNNSTCLRWLLWGVSYMRTQSGYYLSRTTHTRNWCSWTIHSLINCLEGLCPHSPFTPIWKQHV